MLHLCRPRYVVIIQSDSSIYFVSVIGWSTRAKINFMYI